MIKVISTSPRGHDLGLVGHLYCAGVHLPHSMAHLGSLGNPGSRSCRDPSRVIHHPGGSIANREYVLRNVNA